MFGFNNKKRNEANIDTALDRAIKAKKEEIKETNLLLREKVVSIIAANEAIKCYSNGDDKTKAEKVAETRKNGLLALIGHYDCLMRDYNELLNKDKIDMDVENRNTTKGWKNNFSKSHDLVEIAVKDFYRRR